MKLLNNLAGWASEVSFENLPLTAVEKAKECVMDVCSVALAGSRHPATRIMRECLMDYTAPGRCSILGTGEHAAATTAAMANAFAAHVLDFDDTCYAGVIHPSAVLFPTVMALGEEMAASGKDMLLAYIVGLEIEGRVGQAVNPGLYMKGWFTTAVLGVIGASAAAAKMLHLKTSGICSALGLALCQAGGMRQNNGTPAKPYAAGRAAESGILAARMAQRGIFASADILEGPEGFFHIYGDDRHNPAAFNRLGDPFVIISPGVHFKPYPTCSGAHAAMEAVISLAEKNRLSWQQVDRILCRITPVAARGLAYNDPLTPEQAQFSMPFCIACALKDGRLDLTHLGEQSLYDPVIRELMGKVVTEPAESFHHPGATAAEYPEGAEVSIQTVDERIFYTFVGCARGSPSKPFTRDEHQAKFISCAKEVIDDGAISRCLDLIEKLELLENVQLLSRSMII